MSPVRVRTCETSKSSRKGGEKNTDLPLTLYLYPATNLAISSTQNGVPKLRVPWKEEACRPPTSPEARPEIRTVNPSRVTFP